MDDLRGRPFTGSDRWVPVALLPVLIVVGLAFAYYVSGLDDPLFLAPIAWYTAIIAALGVPLVIAYLVSRRLPDGRRGTLGGDQGVVVAGWPWQWRWNATADAGIATLATYLFVSALGSPEARPIAPVVLLIPMTWFGVSTALTLAGRRRLDALMLTDTELVRDSINGRERVHRDQVTDVKVVADRVLVTFSGSAARRSGPRPWRNDDKRHDSMFVIDPRLLGPGPEQIVAWLRRELDLDRAAGASTPTGRVPAMTTITRWFRRPR